MSDDSYLLREEQGGGAVMWQRIKNNPFLAAGIGGFLTAVAIGAYGFKNRPKGTSVSLYLIQLRVAAQSVIIGTLTVGMTYQMVDHWILHPDHTPKKPKEE